MKKYILNLGFVLLGFATFSCEEPETEIHDFTPKIFYENFPESEIDYNQTFDFAGWTNFAEAGTTKWIERDFQNDGYIQFSSFGSGQASNIGWAITPAINLDQVSNEKLTFRSACNFVSDPANKLEVLISTNCDGTNVLTATWTPLTATVANETTNNYTYVSSGEIDLNSYSGNAYIAFRVTGSGTNTNLDGLFQVDDVKVFQKN